MILNSNIKIQKIASGEKMLLIQAGLLPKSCRAIFKFHCGCPVLQPRQPKMAWQCQYLSCRPLCLRTKQKNQLYSFIIPCHSRQALNCMAYPCPKSNFYWNSILISGLSFFYSGYVFYPGISLGNFLILEKHRTTCICSLYDKVNSRSTCICSLYDKLYIVVYRAYYAGVTKG